MRYNAGAVNLSLSLEFNIFWKCRFAAGGPTEVFLNDQSHHVVNMRKELMIFVISCMTNCWNIHC